MPNNSPLRSALKIAALGFALGCLSLLVYLSWPEPNAPVVEADKPPAFSFPPRNHPSRISYGDTKSLGNVPVRSFSGLKSLGPGSLGEPADFGVLVDYGAQQRDAGMPE